ncbi:MAG: ferrous iron transport protein B [Actinomycetota bacterium]|nr:ferrous iron transport protein B [Actinomycetota bacterium]
MSSTEIIAARDESLAHLRTIYGDDVETIIAEFRYGYISGLVKEAVRKPPIDRLTVSDKIDSVLINRWLGTPIFAVVMYGVFWLTFTLSAPVMEWIETGFGWLADQASGIGGWFGSFLADGIIGGVGSVLVFVPIIFLLFLALSILEDSGYLVRAAFVMDRFMHKIGLHGRSFIPMLLGFGCNVPAIMATRAIDNEKDRITTILVNPLMSCGARLPIYVLLAAAFFPNNQGLVVWSMYLIGIALAIAVAYAFRKRLLPGQSSHFVMELPPYRPPTMRGVVVHSWERGKLFLIRAGTIIFAAVVLIWFLDYVGAIEPIGRAIAPIFKPCGFGQWQAAVALAFGLLAKEVVVGTFGVLFAGANALSGGLGNVLGFEMGWSALTAFAFMVFCLIYVPCAAALAAIKQETNSWKWTIFTGVYTTALAWLIAVLIFQIGGLFV